MAGRSGLLKAKLPPKKRPHILIGRNGAFHKALAIQPPHFPKKGKGCGLMDKTNLMTADGL